MDRVLMREQEALAHRWLKGETATDKDILPEIKSYMAKARLRRGIEMVKLANRIEALKMTEDEETADVPRDAEKAAVDANAPGQPTGAKRLSKVARSAIFREVVLAKVREMKENEQKNEITRTISEKKMTENE